MTDTEHALSDTAQHFDATGDCTCNCSECWDDDIEVCICGGCAHTDCGGY